MQIEKTNSEYKWELITTKFMGYSYIRSQGVQVSKKQNVSSLTLNIVGSLRDREVASSASDR